jgi:hypothetical protein
MANDMLRFKTEKSMLKYGLIVDPLDATKVLPIQQLANRQQGAASAGEADVLTTSAKTSSGAVGDTNGSVDSPQGAGSFARETSGGAVGDVTDWDDEAVLAAMKAECAEIRAIEANYPGRYHRLGTLIIESKKRLGDENVRQVLRQEGIDNTKAWRAVQIAELYTFDQAVEFSSLRAILKTLPEKQPRKRKPMTNGSNGDHHLAAPQYPRQVSPEPPTEENIVESFVQLGTTIRELLGDEALDQAVERIRNHTSEIFEDVFAEV